jgi:hypothetical protein
MDLYFWKVLYNEKEFFFVDKTSILIISIVFSRDDVRKILGK